MPQWMRDLITDWFLRDFTEDAAEAHDLAYWLRELPRIDIDRAFLAAMLGQAVTLRQRAKAITIYAMVRLLGWASYRA
jgi:hypothetical protein